MRTGLPFFKVATLGQLNLSYLAHSNPYNEVSFSVPKRRLKKGVASRLIGATDYIVRIDEKTDVSLTLGRDGQLRYINHREIIEKKEYVPSFLEQHTSCHVLN